MKPHCEWASKVIDAAILSPKTLDVSEGQNSGNNDRTLEIRESKKEPSTFPILSQVTGEFKKDCWTPWSFTDAYKRQEKLQKLI